MDMFLYIKHQSVHILKILAMLLGNNKKSNKRHKKRWSREKICSRSYLKSLNSHFHSTLRRSRCWTENRTEKLRNTHLFWSYRSKTIPHEVVLSAPSAWKLGWDRAAPLKQQTLAGFSAVQTQPFKFDRQTIRVCETPRIWLCKVTAAREICHPQMLAPVHIFQPSVCVWSVASSFCPYEVRVLAFNGGHVQLWNMLEHFKYIRDAALSSRRLCWL